jgi:predicted enzyme related to lactoylglutathione lyase
MRASADRCIDYIELPCVDTTRVKAFYSEVFGWKFEDYGPSYTSFFDGRLAGGFTTDAQVTTVGPLVILFAVDLEGIQAKVKAAGGRITRETFSFPGGRRFHFADPEGNILAIWGKEKEA